MVALDFRRAPLRQEEELAARSLAPFWARPGWSVGSRVQWACDRCLKAGRAVEADASKQLYCDFPPYLAYFDVRLRCHDCETTFVFDASEQKYWYETRGFWVQSRPKHCRSCRKARRHRRDINSRLQLAIEGLDANDPESLAGVASLLLEAGSEEKAVIYLRRAKNKARTETQRAAFIQRLEKLGAQ